MTSICKLITSLALVISLLSLTVYAQAIDPKLNHFSADGVSFDYPAEYSVTDESTTEAQKLTLTRKGSSVQLMIVVPRSRVMREELPAAIEKITEPLIKNAAIKLAGNKTPPERVSIKTQVGPKEAEGVRLRSNSRKSTGEVIWLRLGLRLVSMAFARSDADESAGSQLWQTVRSSLKVDAPVLSAMAPGEEPPADALTGEMLNGRALALPKPAYPAIARAAHASGTVTVQVFIDEQGNVIDAKAVDGHPLLQAVSVAAARQAKFSPTLLEGEPVRVTGVIQYHFVAQ